MKVKWLHQGMNWLPLTVRLPYVFYTTVTMFKPYVSRSLLMLITVLPFFSIEIIKK